MGQQHVSEGDNGDFVIEVIDVLTALIRILPRTERNIALARIFQLIEEKVRAGR